MDWEFLRHSWFIMLALALIYGAFFLFVLRGTFGRTAPFSDAERRRLARENQVAQAQWLHPDNARGIDQIGRTAYGFGDVFAGTLKSGREALVRFPTGSGGGLPPGQNPSIEIAAPHAPRVAIRRHGVLDWLIVPHRAVRLPGYVVTSLDPGRARKAFAENERLATAIRVVFEKGHVEHLSLWDGKLRARVSGLLPAEKLRALLHDLDMIVAVFEPVPIAVRVLGGGLRRALQGLAGSPRCSYCHADVTGDEPDLVACGLCHTILHDACWSDLGRCPVLGCPGREPERPEGRAKEPERDGSRGV